MVVEFKQIAMSIGGIGPSGAAKSAAIKAAAVKAATLQATATKVGAAGIGKGLSLAAGIGIGVGILGPAFVIFGGAVACWYLHRLYVRNRNIFQHRARNRAR